MAQTPFDQITNLTKTDNAIRLVTILNWHWSNGGGNCGDSGDKFVMSYADWKLLISGITGSYNDIDNSFIFSVNNPVPGSKIQFFRPQSKGGDSNRLEGAKQADIILYVSGMNVMNYHLNINMSGGPTSQDQTISIPFSNPPGKKFNFGSQKF